MDKSAYERLKTLILAGHFKEIREITGAISMRALQTDMGIGWQALSRRFADPNKFSLGEIRRLADLIGVEPQKIIDLALAQALRKMKRSR